MTPQEQTEALLKWEGWTKCACNNPECTVWFDGEDVAHLGPPDYGSLDEIARCEDGIISDANMGYAYESRLIQVTGAHDPDVELINYLKLWHATAAQRREALLKTLGLWKEDK